MENPFLPFIQTNGCALLDGGLATELEKMGHDLNHALWSAKVLIDAPNSIEKIHLSYLEAGSNCITTATYQLSFAGAARQGYSRKQTQQFFSRAMRLARRAIDRYEALYHPVHAPLAAAGLGPYASYLANGSEYTGKYEVSLGDIADFHRARLNASLETWPDLIAFETIPNIQEAEVIRGLIDDATIPFWISFCCKDEQLLSDGNPLYFAANLFSDAENVAGIGINCTPPQLISPLIDIIQESAPGVPAMAYPNSGEKYQPETRTWSKSSQGESFTELAKKWYRQGLKIVGGCCRTGPADIRSLRQSRP